MLVGRSNIKSINSKCVEHCAALVVVGGWSAFFLEGYFGIEFDQDVGAKPLRLSNGKYLIKHVV